MRKTRKTLAVLLTLSMVLGMMSGMSFTALAEGEVNATAEINAGTFTSESINVTALDVTVGDQTAAGVQGLVEGATAVYENILFTGEERFINVAAVTQHRECWYFNADVYVDDATVEANKIAELRDVKTGTNGWAASDGYMRNTMSAPVEAGTHKLIFVGKNPTQRVETPCDSCAAAADAGTKSGLAKFQFVEGPWSLDVAATTQVVASDFTDAHENIGWQEGMFFPGQQETTTLTGIIGLIGGNWVRYDGITFSGEEAKISVDYGTRTGIVQGNFDVYIDEVNEDNLIVSARKVDGGEWNWTTVKTSEFFLNERVDAGVHDVIFVGLDNTPGPNYDETDWGVNVAGMRTFNFIEGELPTFVNATDEFLASEYTQASGVGVQEGMFFPGDESTKADGINTLYDGNWARYDYVIFSGNERTFSFEYATLTGAYLGNLEIYIDDITPQNLIAKASKVTGGDWSWATVKTHEVTMSQQVPEGTHSVYIVGLESEQDPNYVNSDDYAASGEYPAIGGRAGIRAFRFVEGEWPTEKAATSEFVASKYSDKKGVGVQENMFFPNQTDTGLDGINTLYDGNWVRYDSVVFDGSERSFSFEYATLTGAYLGNLEIYLNEISSENLIAKANKLTGGEWSWATVKTHEVTMTKQVAAGTHSVIIVGLESEQDPNYVNSDDYAASGEYPEIGGRAGIRSFRFKAGDNSLTSMYDAEGNEISLSAIDFEWEPGSDYTFTTTVVADEEVSPQLLAALYDAEGRLMSIGLSEAGTGELSATLTAPADGNYDGAYTATYLWDAESRMPLATADKKERVITVGCLGDSITAGNPHYPWETAMQSSYATHIGEALGADFKLINPGGPDTGDPEDEVNRYFGQPSATVYTHASGQGRLAEAAAAKCEIYTIMLGTNDANFWNDETSSVDQLKADYRTIIDTLLAANPNAKIFVLTSPRVLPDESGTEPIYALMDNRLKDIILPAIREVAAANNLTVIDLNAEMWKGDPDEQTLASTWGFGDRIHFSAAGATKIGTFIGEAMLEALNAE